MRSSSDDNVGFDIWAHKHALDAWRSRLAEFDEIVLTNDTWFGPVRSLRPVFDADGHARPLTSGG